jgi:hypothetical protein
MTNSQWDTFKLIHRLIIGDADDKIKLGEAWNKNLQFEIWLIYFFATILLIIIMLNLLIAIIGDSFNKVRSMERLNFNYERANLLYEIDKKI